MSTVESTTSTTSTIPTVALERQFDAVALNATVNDPSVYPWVRGSATGPLDLSAIAEDPSNVLLVGDHGSLLFTPLQAGIWEAHTQVVSAGRGEWAVALATTALDWLFCNTDAVEVLTKVPRGHIAAKALAAAVGGTPAFVVPDGWVLNGKPIATTLYSLTLQTWLARRAAVFAPLGEWFHKTLEAQYAARGYTTPLHAHDDTHDAMVGVVVEMVRSGQPFKGAVFYNRWAGLANYAPITVLGVDPVVLDIEEAVLCVRGSYFDVIQLRNKDA